MAPTAEAAILCGDPARALLLAQELLVEPRMSNHHRGLWGYWGRRPDGAELTVHATGIGGPSAAIVLGELIDAGVRRAIRIGTCSSPDGSLGLGTSVVATTAAVVGGPPIAADRGLGDALIAAGAGSAVAAISLERPVPADDGPLHIHGGPGASASAHGPLDLQTAALAALAAGRGVAFAAALVVTESDGAQLEDESLEAVVVRLGRAAAAVLAETGPDTARRQA
jgi:hypothetical protein